MASRSVDVLLRDIQMPRLDGLGALAECREVAAATKVVMLICRPR